MHVLYVLKEDFFCINTSISLMLLIWYYCRCFKEIFQLQYDSNKLTKKFKAKNHFFELSIFDWWCHNYQKYHKNQSCSMNILNPLSHAKVALQINWLVFTWWQLWQLLMSKWKLFYKLLINEILSDQRCFQVSIF